MSQHTNSEHPRQEIASLVTRGEIDVSLANATTFNGVETHASNILPFQGVVRYPHLDAELRDLFVEALGLYTNERPSLREMLRRTQAGMNKPASAYPGRELEESDYAVSMVLQQILYNPLVEEHKEEEAMDGEAMDED